MSSIRRLNNGHCHASALLLFLFVRIHFAVLCVVDAVTESMKSIEGAAPVQRLDIAQPLGLCSCCFRISHRFFLLAVGVHRFQSRLSAIKGASSTIEKTRNHSQLLIVLTFIQLPHVFRTVFKFNSAVQKFKVCVLVISIAYPRLQQARCRPPCRRATSPPRNSLFCSRPTAPI